jgi:hypothetical protein
MLEFEVFDLSTDPEARAYVKDEIVEVQFATCDGLLESREGPNRYEAGDALITGSTGDRWSVSRGRFDLKYEPLANPGDAGIDSADLQPVATKRYRNRPHPVLARCILEPFTARRSAAGDRLHGTAGDWLVQYAPGDYGVVEKTRFAQVYVLSDDPSRVSL